MPTQERKTQYSLYILVAVALFLLLCVAIVIVWTGVVGTSGANPEPAPQAVVNTDTNAPNRNITNEATNQAVESPLKKYDNTVLVFFSDDDRAVGTLGITYDVFNDSLHAVYSFYIEDALEPSGGLYSYGATLTHNGERRDAVAASRVTDRYCHLNDFGPPFTPYSPKRTTDDCLYHVDRTESFTVSFMGTFKEYDTILSYNTLTLFSTREYEPDVETIVTSGRKVRTYKLVVERSSINDYMHHSRLKKLGEYATQ